MLKLGEFLLMQPYKKAKGTYSVNVLYEGGDFQEFVFSIQADTPEHATNEAVNALESVVANAQVAINKWRRNNATP